MGVGLGGTSWYQPTWKLTLNYTEPTRSVAAIWRRWDWLPNLIFIDELPNKISLDKRPAVKYQISQKKNIKILPLQSIKTYSILTLLTKICSYS